VTDFNVVDIIGDKVAAFSMSDENSFATIPMIEPGEGGTEILVLTVDQLGNKVTV
jgi:hypothetical protein